MKTTNLFKLPIIVLMLVGSFSSFSQEWNLGGNLAVGPDAVTPANNILGTNFSIFPPAQPLRIRTNGTFRMFIADGGATAADGFLGVGNGFLTPRSRLHLHQGTSASTNGVVFTQWTNFAIGGATPLITDGFQLGIDATGNAQLRQQEPSLPIQFILNSGSTTSERSRVVAGSQIINDPANTILTNDVTRMGIWETGGNPLGLRPVSLLQIGVPQIPTPGMFGYRNWMDIGTYINIGSDNMYVGLKNENTSTNQAWSDRMDAVINWGNNPSSSTSNGDRLRFIFTATSGNGNASGFNGLEIARMWSNGNDGRMGVGGDPTFNRYFGNQPEPTNTLEINTTLVNSLSSTASGLRFTDVNNTVPAPVNPTNGVLSLNGSGDVIWVKDQIGGIVGACSPSLPSLSSDAGTDLAGNNFYFRGQGGIKNSVGIGIPCGTALTAKLDVLQQGANTVGINVLNSFSTNNLICFGLISKTTGTNDDNYGGWFEATGQATTNVGARFLGQNAGFNYGALGVAMGIGNSQNRGGDFRASGGSISFGIYAQGGTEAGHFVGNVTRTGTDNFTSDSTLKENRTPLTNGLASIRSLTPKTFTYKTTTYPYLNLPSGTQYGFIAQDVDTVLPELVQTIIHPAEYDTAGNQISPQLALKALSYTEIIPITVRAVQQLDSIITEATSPPPAPILISPADGASGDFSKVTFTWHSVSEGVILYRAQVAKDNSFSNIVIDRSGITDTTFSAAFCDSIPTTYYWRVNAKNNAGTGAWSQVFSFTDTAICLKLPSPIGGVRGTEFQVAFASASDANWKINIAPMTDALDKVTALNPITYNWDASKTTNMHVDSKNQIGLLAQDVEQIVPEVVYTDSVGMKYIDYGRLSIILLAGMKEQQAQIITLQGGGSRTNENGQTEIEKIKLTLPDAPVLGDARPNPNSGYAEIPYYLPENVSNGKIIFIDMLGRTMYEKNLASGYGAFGIDTSDLPSGTYTYTMILNGKTIATKNMIKTK